MKEQPVIKAKRLGYKSGQRYLIRDINWEVEKGQHWVVFGMNGSGKTTLFSIIGGFKTYTHGELELFGSSVADMPLLELRKRIGVVSSSVFDKFYTKERALDIVLSGLSGTLTRQYGCSDEDVVRAKHLLSQFHLQGREDYPFHLLSKGERQNVLVARALISRPDILVLDEPGTGLDVFSRAYLLETVQKLAENTDVTIIYVTHYPEEISSIFQKCMLLRNGRIYDKGETRQLLTTENMSAFLEYPVTVQQNNGTIQFKLDVQSDMQSWL
ncbi:MAG: ABC transporter ATP-binding protein [Peptococcaceae bacterium]